MALAHLSDSEAIIAINIIERTENVDIDSLDPEDRICSVCHEEMIPRLGSNYLTQDCPVRLVCNHVFGAMCIGKWMGTCFGTAIRLFENLLRADYLVAH